MLLSLLILHLPYIALGFHSKQQQPHRPSLSLPAVSRTAFTTIQIGAQVGSGSYGTVHLCELQDGTNAIAKRAWTKEELEERGTDASTEERCRYYFSVEEHCFQKLQLQRMASLVPVYLGTFQDDNHGYPWMTFEIITGVDGKTPAPTLQDLLQLDWKDQHMSKIGEDGKQHHLYRIQQALGIYESATLSDTLDIIFTNLLQVIQFIHSLQIVHRDVKPSNILVSPSQQLVLMDFGSAADMEPVRVGLLQKRIGLADRVAVSPVYAAPEIFIDPNKSPLQFDVFSVALIFCQLVFNYLDERTDAAFHQQIQDVNWDLNAWLSREVSSKLRPVGLDEALLDYIATRPGLWALLGDMLKRDPERRISSEQALQRWQQILGKETKKHDDGPFLEALLTVMDTCEVPPDMEKVEPRPLHYVASFERDIPLGIVLAEATVDLEFDDSDKFTKWRDATNNAQPGDVFIQDILRGGRAEALGALEIGDQLHMVGDIPVAQGGFEKVAGLLKKQPSSNRYVKLQFDRRSARQQWPLSPTIHRDSSAYSGAVHIVDEGAWSSLGRRKANEDTFVLHDIHLPDGTDVLLAGVFDGHGGTAASKMASELLPSLFSQELQNSAVTSRQALERAWEDTCVAYRNKCDEADECVAEYDSIDGILLASTGSEDAVAGTTASVLSLTDKELTILNCGDSRTVFISQDGIPEFCTEDHSPDMEISRLQRGIDKGLGYVLPQCSLSRWWMTVGDMQYSVGRSLEGPFATSKGIVSTPDVTSLRPKPGILLVASDGLWEVSGVEQIAKDVTWLRKQGVDASTAAKRLCTQAIATGSTDNVSIVLVYLE
jgi:serine/threonine protein phosphatase PrpC/serine/threonine protein kinase